MTKTPSLYFQDQQPAQVLEQTKLILARIDHGVLAVTILANGAVHEQTLQDIEAQIRRNLKHAGKLLVLDCTQMTQCVSSQFLGVLVKLHKTMAASGGSMSVCGVTGHLREAFEVTKLQRLIPVYDSLKEALYKLGEFSEWEKVGIESVRKSGQPTSSNAEYGMWLTPKAAFLAMVAIFVLGISLGFVINGFSSAKPAKRNVQENNSSAVLKNNPEARKTAP